MSAKIRLQRKGSKKRPFYSLVVADSRAPRDGKYIEKLGSYNPLLIPASINVDVQRAILWLKQGAVPTKTAKRILSFKGVLFYKHLLRGVELNLFDQATADKKFADWQVEHEKVILEKEKHHLKKKEEKRNKDWDFSIATKQAKQELKKASAEDAPAPSEAPQA